MSFIDLGEKRGMEVCSPGSSSDVYYPTIYIDGKDLPFDDDDVGEIVEAKVIVKLASMTTSNSGSGDRTSCSFEVKKIDFQKNKEAEDYTHGRVETKKGKGG